MTPPYIAVPITPATYLGVKSLLARLRCGEACTISEGLSDPRCQPLQGAKSHSSRVDISLVLRPKVVEQCCDVRFQARAAQTQDSGDLRPHPLDVLVQVLVKLHKGESTHDHISSHDPV